MFTGDLCPSSTADGPRLSRHPGRARRRRSRCRSPVSGSSIISPIIAGCSTQQAQGRLAITWTNHTYTHPYRKGVARRRQFPADARRRSRFRNPRDRAAADRQRADAVAVLPLSRPCLVLAADAGGAAPSSDLARRRRLAGAQPEAARRLDHPRASQRQRGAGTEDLSTRRGCRSSACRRSSHSTRRRNEMDFDCSACAACRLCRRARPRPI